MRLTIVDHVLVDFVREDQYVGIAHDVSQRVDVSFFQNGTGRIMRRVDHNKTCLWSDSRSHFIPRNAVAIDANRHLHKHRYAASQFDGWNIAVIGWFNDDDFITGMHSAQYRSEDALRSAGSDGNLALGIVAMPVQCLNFLRNRFPQYSDTSHRWILVQAFAHGIADGID